MPRDLPSLTLFLWLLSLPALADDTPDFDALEQAGAVIGDVILDKADVFDLDNPEENRALYRAANRLHVITRDSTVRKQLLFGPGEPFSRQRIEETERILRQNKYLYDAEIEPLSYENGVVDLLVRTRDIWSISPELSLSRSGGENRTRIGVEEANLLGRGQNLRYVHDNDVDRTEDTFAFFDRHLGRSWVSLQLLQSNNSDGHEQRIRIERPFYALDTRWSTGVSGLDRDSRETIYALGEESAEYREQAHYLAGWYGWSRGLRDNWVTRWTAGIVHDQAEFSTVQTPTLPSLIPEDRKLVYGFVSVEILENEFATSMNRDQIGKHEDFQMGTRWTGSLGWADDSLGADRDALVYAASASHGFGSMDATALLASTSVSGRRESGRSANVLFNFDSRFYHTQSRKRVFFASLSGSAGHALDLDNLIRQGGDTGLRGYPLRYQTGESKLLVTVEQRYYTDWYPWRLFRVGGAVFADIGRVWGPSPVDEPRQGWLKDIGFGLRLPLTRISSTKVVHFDVAFALDGDDSIDSVQFLLEAKRSF
ncbi:MAG TPA: hypothetical protein VIS31_00660 [Woeseiaceae bacterium]